MRGIITALMMLLSSATYADDCANNLIKGKAPLKGIVVMHQFQPSTYESPLHLVAEFLAQRHWSVMLQAPDNANQCQVPEQEVGKKKIFLAFGDLATENIEAIKTAAANFDGLVLVSIQSKETIQAALAPWLEKKNILDVVAEFDFPPTLIAAQQRQQDLGGKKRYQQSTVLGAIHDYEYAEVVLAKEIQSWLKTLKTRETDE